MQLYNRRCSLLRLIRHGFFALVMLLFSITLLQAQNAPQPNAQVKHMSAVLNLRAAPYPDAEVLAELTGGTALIALGRTADNAWLKVQTLDSQIGWAAAGYIELSLDLITLPIMTADTLTVPASTEAATPVVPQAAAPSDGIVKALALNLRTAPSLRGAILVRLPARTPLKLLARTPDNAWLKVEALAQQGWVSAVYVQLNLDLNALPVETASGAVESSAVPAGGAPVSTEGVISNITDTARAIYRGGQNKGNQPTVFSKVGDSITVAADMYDPIGRGVYNLGGYGYLQSVIDFFMSSQNSFTSISAAAGPGWTTKTILDPASASSALCLSGETPLTCEYRVRHPAVALIMIGSNDVRYFDAGTYQYNLQQIVQTTIDAGVVPVISTIPSEIGYEQQVIDFNNVIRGVAGAYGIPLWDYAGVMAALPSNGLSGDGLHPSTSPAGYQGAADFNGDNLQYGYVMRNLTMLQVLDTVWRQVIGSTR